MWGGRLAEAPVLMTLYILEQFVYGRLLSCNSYTAGTSVCHQEINIIATGQKTMLLLLRGRKVTDGLVELTAANRWVYDKVDCMSNCL